jgi:hypothetical protein
MRQELMNIDVLFKNSRKLKLTFLQKPRYFFSIVGKIKIKLFTKSKALLKYCWKVLEA